MHENILTDHRVSKDTIYILNPETSVLLNSEGLPVHPFWDRSFVRDGCECDYCKWGGDD